MQTVKQQAIFQTPMTQTKLNLSNSFGWRRWRNPKHAVYAPDHRIMFNNLVDDNDYHYVSDCNAANSDHFKFTVNLFDQTSLLLFFMFDTTSHEKAATT